MGVEKIFLGTILVLTIVLAVVVAFGFYASMTADRVVGVGYPVSQSEGGGGVSPSSGVTYQGVLNMLNHCIVKAEQPGIGETAECSTICNSVDKTCVGGEVTSYTFPDLDFINTDLVECNDDWTHYDPSEYINLYCYCCSP